MDNCPNISPPTVLYNITMTIDINKKKHVQPHAVFVQLFSARILFITRILFIYMCSKILFNFKIEIFFVLIRKQKNGYN